MKKIKNILLFSFLFFFLASCQTTSSNLENKPINFRLAKLTLAGDWKHQGQNKLFGHKFDKRQIEKITRDSIYKKLRKFNGTTPINVHVTLEQFFIPNTGFKVLTGFGSSQHMVGRITIQHAKSKKLIKDRELVFVYAAYHEAFAEKVKEAVLDSF